MNKHRKHNGLPLKASHFCKISFLFVAYFTIQISIAEPIECLNPDNYTSHPYLTIALKTKVPCLKTKINSLGFIGEDYPKQNSPTHDVLILGDSLAWKVSYELINGNWDSEVGAWLKSHPQFADVGLRWYSGAHPQLKSKDTLTNLILYGRYFDTIIYIGGEPDYLNFTNNQLPPSPHPFFYKIYPYFKKDNPNTERKKKYRSKYKPMSHRSVDHLVVDFSQTLRLMFKVGKNRGQNFYFFAAPPEGSMQKNENPTLNQQEISYQRFIAKLEKQLNNEKIVTNLQPSTVQTSPIKKLVLKLVLKKLSNLNDQKGGGN